MTKLSIVLAAAVITLLAGCAAPAPAPPAPTLHIQEAIASCGADVAQVKKALGPEPQYQLTNTEWFSALKICIDARSPLPLNEIWGTPPVTKEQIWVAEDQRQKLKAIHHREWENQQQQTPGYSWQQEYDTQQIDQRLFNIENRLR